MFQVDQVQGMKVYFEKFLPRFHEKGRVIVVENGAVVYCSDGAKHTRGRILSILTTPISGHRHSDPSLGCNGNRVRATQSHRVS
jgi:hypothetical protein